ncbi:MAG: phosphatase PAP2 family protein [Candidatus Baltobacteraceae bacterium]
MPPARKEHDRAGAARALLFAIVAYAVFLALGLVVAHAPPGPFDVASHVLIGHSALIAWILSWTLYMQVLAPICLVLIAVAIAKPEWRVRIAVSLAVLLVMWFASDQLQHVFLRARRLDWVVKHETAFSYPSGHATLAVAFYGYWAYVLYKSELPLRVRLWGAALLTMLITGVLWARLALGAHYPSDVTGGALLGTSGICFAVAVCRFLQVPLDAGSPGR